MSSLAEAPIRVAAASRRRQKVLLITNIFPPHIGGPATFIDRLAHELSGRGYRVTVVCSSDTDVVESDRGRPFKVCRVSLSNRELYEIKVRLVLFWYLLRHRTVLVNGLEGYVAQVSALLRRKYALKVVGDTAWETARNHGTTLLDIDDFQNDANEQKRHEGLIARRNRSFRRAQRVFTPSEYLRSLVIGWGVPAERVITIPNGVAIEDPPSPRRRTSAASCPLQVLFVGRLTNWKGVETLLLVLTELADVRATIVGDGPQYPHLVELARQLGLTDKVTFVGRQHADSVRQLMRESDALILTSLYEGMSHTLLEASALGCPCIASNVGGNRELITSGVNGLLVPPQDVPALRATLVALKEDPALHARLVEGAARLSGEYRLNRTVDKVVELLTT